MKHLESKLQIECVKWFRYQYPNYRMLLFAIPNGGKRNAITAQILKSEGVVSGVADLFLSIPKGKFHGLYIEMKYGKGIQSDNQKEFEKNVIAMGYKYIITNSLYDFVKEIDLYMGS